MNGASVSSITKGGLAAVVVLVVLVVLFTGYGGLNTLGKLFGQNQPAQLEGFDGTLFLSVGTVASTTGVSTGFAPITVSVASSAVQFVRLNQIGEYAALSLQHSMSRDAGYATFLATPLLQLDETTMTSDENLTVYRADIRNALDFDDFVRTLHDADAFSVPTNEDYFRQAPVVSERGAVAYASLSKDSYETHAERLDLVPAEDWNIYVVEQSGDKRMVNKGLRPKWVSDSQLAFLKNDGIYVYDITTDVERKVWSQAGGMTLVNGFDVSDDGEFAVITDPSSATMTVIRVLNWSAGIVARFAEVPIVATNPVFSPNSRYIAAIVLRPNKEVGGPHIPGIEYFSIKDKRMLPGALAFDPSEIDALYLTDWR